MTTLEEFDRWLSHPEGLNLEFKAARNDFGRKNVMDYCAALANEGGGKLVLGVDDAVRHVTGSSAYRGTHQTLSHEIFQNTEPHLRVDVEELSHLYGRALIFHVPARPRGCPIRSNGKYTYPMRLGESLKEMDNETLRRIYAEIEEDFSARVVSSLTLSDLNGDALAEFRRRRAEKARNPSLLHASAEQLLRDVHLLDDRGVTFACLVLLGKRESIQMHLPQCEIIYEWRGAHGQIHHDFRVEWKEPYFLLYDIVWRTINERNIRTPYQEGFIQQEIWAFDEKSCREAVNNAVSHREYSLPGSIYILASPSALAVVSPGGFPPGITSDNIIEHAPVPRNRLIAEVLEQTRLVERSGQGVDDIFQASIQQGKGLPSYDGTDASEVRISVPAAVQDAGFVRFVEKAINERQVALSMQEWVELENIRITGKTSAPQHRDKFLELGLIEQHGKTRDAHYVLSQEFYEHIGRRGIHTREAGLSRDAKKRLILEHLQRHGRVQRQELRDAFPNVPLRILSGMLQDLKDAGVIAHIGSRKTGYWVLVKPEINKSNPEAKNDIHGSMEP
ncbi:putative DNA binding domain-containing protein [Candidatus Peregrinibacteria bacterium]|nr:putative DNA binding domain-containing protein [Candidatus Peregrinibacteria bacterium]